MLFLAHANKSGLPGMNRYFIEMSFKGTHFHGWQIQPNARSVQECLHAALHTLTGEDIQTVGAGRTDAGVHARFFVAHFDSDHPLPADKNMFLYKMNAILPQDICLTNIYRVKSDAHARYSAVLRTYEYIIGQVRDPFTLDFAWYYNRPLNVEAMNESCSVLLKLRDFTSFCKLHGGSKTNTCQVHEAHWTKQINSLKFVISADRFLRNMVRSLVGTMVLVGRGKLDIEAFVKVAEGKNRQLAGCSAPAAGLSLISILYEKETDIIVF